MQRFVIVSGVFFAFICCVWLARLALGVPVRVSDVDIPVWVSVFPVLIAGSLAVWAFRLLATGGSRPV